MKNFIKAIVLIAAFLTLHKSQAQSVQITDVQFEGAYSSVNFEIVLPITTLKTFRVVIGSEDVTEYFKIHLGEYKDGEKIKVFIPNLSEEVSLSIFRSGAYCVSIYDAENKPFTTCGSEMSQMKKGDVDALYSTVSDGEILLKINSNSDMVGNVSVFDMVGKRIPIKESTFSIVSGTNTFRVNCTGFATGVYLIKVESHTGELLGINKVVVNSR